MWISANGFASDESLTFNGSAETDGRFVVYCRAGDDRITGGLGADVLRGGAGNDTFVYLSVADSTASAMDRILDFGSGDRIDLSAIDANSALGGNQSFTFIGAAAFTGTAGQLRAYQQDGVWKVEGDVNGDGVADLVIAVTTTGGHELTAADFWL